jgi:hypothetical protein
MKTNSLSALRALFCCVFSFGIIGSGWGQNSFNSGDGWGAGWGNGSAMSSSSGTSLIYTATNTSGSGDRYFRFYGTGTPCGQYGPQNSSVQLSTNTVYTSSTLTCGNNTYAYYLAVTNTTDNWIFKSASPTAQRIIIFRIQGAVRTFAASPHSRDILNPTNSQSPVITATLNDVLNTGQGVYLRYTTDDFVTSTIVEMTNSTGANYTASIPAQSFGTTVKYYMFTSGNGLTIPHADADLYTINAATNSGSNYSYTVVSASTITSFTPSSGYVGSTITITGTNLTGATAVSIGGAAAASYVVDSDTQISAVVADGASTGNISVTTPGGTATSSSSFTFNGYITAQTGGWNTSATWLGGAVPPLSASTNVTIAHDVTSTSGTVSVGRLSVNSSVALTVSSSTTISVNIASTNSGTITNNGTLIIGAAYTNGGSITVNGTLQMNSGASIANTSPIYGTSSTLNYNTGNTSSAKFQQALEWPSSSGPTNVIITNSTWIELTSDRSLSGNLTVSSGAFQGAATATRILTMNGTTQTITVSNSSNGNIYGTDNNGGNLQLTIANGSTTTFTGDASTSNDDNKKFFSIDVNAGGTLILSRGILCKAGTFTLNGTLQINSGGYIQSLNGVSPTYSSGSTLKYNVGAAYGRSTEWNDNDASGSGYPHHVQISNNTTLNFNNGLNTPGFMAGNLTIDAGSKLSMESLQTASSTVGLTVAGNIVNSGTVEMNTTTERLKCTNFTNYAGSTMTMSTSVGGDLEVTGNLTENGNLNSSTRAIFFTGTGIQDIQGSGTFSVDYIVLNKASGSVRMLCDLLCEGPNGGNAMTLTNTTDILDLNGYTLTLGKASVNSVMSGSGYLKTTSNSSLSILGTGNFGTINFDPSSNTIGSLTLNRTSTNAGATLGENLTATTFTITSGTLTLAANKQLTVSGTLTNNGTMTIESGATFKQGSSVTGSGTYNVKQTIDNGAGSGSTLSGRFWYLGSPLICTRSSAFGASGNLNKVWQFSNGAYSNVADGSSLSPTTGYVHRRSDASSTLTFSGQNLYAQDVTLSLSNNAGTYGGWHLVSNPYTAYLNWNQIVSNSTGISNTYYIRSYHSSNQDVNALISYNASSGLESNTSSFSLGSAGSTTAQYIAPLQAFWVKVPTTSPLSATAGQLNLQRAFTSHQTGTLKNTGVYPVLARVNLYDGAKFDQMLVYMNEFMTNVVDQNDSEKMFVSGVASIYTMASGKKLVMNGLKNNKKKISVPLYLELPTSKVYQLQLSEYIMEDGLILLEDKQEGTMQDFTIHDTYAFYANSGVLSNRFVLHFFMPDATITAQGPSNSWVQDENEVNEGGSILVSSNGRGKVTIQQDIDPIAADGSQVLIRDASGRMVYEGQLEGTQTSLQLDAPSGVYFVEVQLNGQVEVKKIFVQQ